MKNLLKSFRTPSRKRCVGEIHENILISIYNPKHFHEDLQYVLGKVKKRLPDVPIQGVLVVDTGPTPKIFHLSNVQDGMAALRMTNNNGANDGRVNSTSLVGTPCHIGPYFYLPSMATLFEVSASMYDWISEGVELGERRVILIIAEDANAAFTANMAPTSATAINNKVLSSWKKSDATGGCYNPVGIISLILCSYLTYVRVNENAMDALDAFIKQFKDLGWMSDSSVKAQTNNKNMWNYLRYFSILRSVFQFPNPGPIRILKIIIQGTIQLPNGMAWKPVFRLHSGTMTDTNLDGVSTIFYADILDDAAFGIGYTTFNINKVCYGDIVLSFEHFLPEENQPKRFFMIARHTGFLEPPYCRIELKDLDFYADRGYGVKIEKNFIIDVFLEYLDFNSDDLKGDQTITEQDYDILDKAQQELEVVEELAEFAPNGPPPKFVKKPLALHKQYNPGLSDTHAEIIMTMENNSFLQELNREFKARNLNRYTDEDEDLQDIKPEIARRKVDIIAEMLDQVPETDIMDFVNAFRDYQEEIKDVDQDEIQLREQTAKKFIRKATIKLKPGEIMDYESSDEDVEYIDRVSSTRNLGSLLDENLEFDPRIVEILQSLEGTNGRFKIEDFKNLVEKDMDIDGVTKVLVLDGLTEISHPGKDGSKSKKFFSIRDLSHVLQSKKSNQETETKPSSATPPASGLNIDKDFDGMAPPPPPSLSDDEDVVVAPGPAPELSEDGAPPPPPDVSDSDDDANVPPAFPSKIAALEDPPLPPDLSDSDDENVALSRPGAPVPSAGALVPPPNMASSDDDDTVPALPLPSGASPMPPSPIKPKKKLKQLHWNTIPKNKIKDTVFAKSDDIKIDDEYAEEIDELFSSVVAKKIEVAEIKNNTITFLDARKLTNFEIVLSKFAYVPQDIVNAVKVLDPNRRVLSDDNLEALISLHVSEEELQAARDFDGSPEDLQKLAIGDQLTYLIAKVPRWTSLLAAAMTIRTFDDAKKEIEKFLEIVALSCDELKENEHFRVLLATILVVGNYLNDGTRKGKACGFKLDVLSKLTETKGKDQKTTLLHYIVNMLGNKSPDVLSLPNEIQHLNAATKVSLSEVLTNVQNLAKSVALLGRELNGLKAEALARRDADTTLLDSLKHIDNPENITHEESEEPIDRVGSSDRSNSRHFDRIDSNFETVGSNLDRAASNTYFSRVSSSTKNRGSIKISRDQGIADAKHVELAFEKFEEEVEILTKKYESVLQKFENLVLYLGEDPKRAKSEEIFSELSSFLSSFSVCRAQWMEEQDRRKRKEAREKKAEEERKLKEEKEKKAQLLVEEIAQEGEVEIQDPEASSITSPAEMEGGESEHLEDKHEDCEMPESQDVLLVQGAFTEQEGSFLQGDFANFDGKFSDHETAEMEIVNLTGNDEILALNENQNVAENKEEFVEVKDHYITKAQEQRESSRNVEKSGKRIDVDASSTSSIDQSLADVSSDTDSLENYSPFNIGSFDSRESIEDTSEPRDESTRKYSSYV